jgi:hypothetical protein
VPDGPRPFLEEFPDLAGIEELFTRSYTLAEYRAHLHSVSLYRMLDDTRRETVIEDTIAAVEAHGPGIDFAVHTYAAMARRAI